LHGTENAQKAQALREYVWSIRKSNALFVKGKQQENVGLQDSLFVAKSYAMNVNVIGIILKGQICLD
jgi:hypothetical protein